MGQRPNLSFRRSNLISFGAGTLILTDHGEVPVESLRVGDRLATRHGGTPPIRWVWRRNVVPAHSVKIAAQAFAEGRPKRDLWLSPDSAVLFDGVLIPVRQLINGHSIALRAREAVDDWHVQLERHDVLLAENLPIESFRDTGERAAFARAAGQEPPRDDALCFDAAREAGGLGQAGSVRACGSGGNAKARDTGAGGSQDAAGAWDRRWGPAL